MTPEEKKQLNEVLEWKRLREKQIIPDQLDVVSKEILTRDFLPVYKAGVLLTPIASGDYISKYFQTKIKNQDEVITYTKYKKYTVNPSNDTFSANDHGLVNDMQVIFATTDEYPVGVDTTAARYVINATAVSFKVSATVGGAAVNITTAGEGDQYFFIV